MARTDSTFRKQHYAEEIGLYFEQLGLTRMAGRIIGWLLVCDPPEQTMHQLAEALHASKGSISSMTRLLIQLGLVERISIPGERRDYFRLRKNAWGHVMEARLVEVRRLREMAERGLDVLADEPPAARRRLAEMRDLYAYFERELPALIARWNAHSTDDG